MRTFSLGGSRSKGASFEAIYRSQHPSLVRYLVRLTGDEDAAEDIAQEAFVRLLRHPELDGNGARLWLYTVAMNLVRDRGRMASRRRRLLEAGPVPVPTPSPHADERIERAEQVERVRSALALLSPRDQQMLLMREEGFRYEEIAKAIDVAPGSVGTLIARALKRFASAYRTDEVTDDAR